MISDVVLRGELPQKARKSIELWAGCVAGAILEADYLRAIREAGFAEVVVVSERNAGELLEKEPGLSRQELQRLGEVVVSVELKATK